jgi:flavin-dependent dehydrogenase
MHNLVVALGVTVKLGSKVVSYMTDEGAIILQDGTKVTADIVVAADGKCYVESVVTSKLC